MDKLLMVDWQGMFVPVMGLADIVLRGTVMYLALFAIMRFMARREAGNSGPADMLVIVLIADAAQNALGAEYRSVTESALLVLTIVVWDYAIDWLAWRFPTLRPVLRATAAKLIEEGQIIHENLRVEMHPRKS
jgi:uncharacterized membrane protein YcaP (DUF421 family)